jgi:IclR family transcriptional regulator, pca regulon regulatory protein
LSTETWREGPATAQSNAKTPARRANNETVQGLRRGFAVIKAFTAESPALSISQVAERTGLTRAVARRYLLTLEELGCVVQNGSSFRLTPRLLDLGFTYLTTLDVANVAQPVMEAVVAKLHESCSVAVLDSYDIVYVARVAARRIMSINLAVGSRLPAHATSMGKILLAHLSPEGLDAYFQDAPLQRLTKRTICDEASLRAALKEVKSRGWAINDQDCEDGIRTLAAPLFDRSNKVVAAINISAHAARVSMKELKRDHLPVVLDAARQVSRTLGANIDSTKKWVGVQ